MAGVPWSPDAAPGCPLRGPPREFLTPAAPPAPWQRPPAPSLPRVATLAWRPSRAVATTDREPGDTAARCGCAGPTIAAVDVPCAPRTSGCLSSPARLPASHPPVRPAEPGHGCCGRAVLAVIRPAP